MRFIQFILANLLRFKYFGILLLAFLPVVFLDNKDVFMQTEGRYHYPAQIVYILCAVICYLLFSVRFTSQISCLIVLSLFYNYLFLRSKNDLFIEFLFMAFFYLSIHLILLNRAVLRYVVPLLLALVAMLKPVGVSLLVAYLFYLPVFRLHSKKQKILETGATLLLVALTVLAFYFLLPSSVNRYFWNLSGYAELVQGRPDTFTYLITNFETYPGYILNFFEQDLPGFIQATIQVVCVALFFIGLYFSVKNQFGFIDTAFIAYVTCLFLLPFNAFGQFLPIVPLFFYYMANSILSASNFLVLYLQHRFAIWFFLVLLFSNTFSIWIMYYGA
jgi:hypothetical protein